MFQMLGVFAEFERSLIRERVKAGLNRAKQNGKTLGRPKIDLKKDRAIREALTKGETGIKKIAKTYSVGVSFVQRIRDDIKNQQPTPQRARP